MPLSKRKKQEDFLMECSNAKNPDCGKEHDGSFGSGRFCSLQCRRHYNGITAAKTAIKNGNHTLIFRLESYNYFKIVTNDTVGYQVTLHHQK